MNKMSKTLKNESKYSLHWRGQNKADNPNVSRAKEAGKRQAPSARRRAPLSSWLLIAVIIALFGSM